jgi:uncharacterized protein YecE (DUF72 family)
MATVKDEKIKIGCCGFPKGMRQYFSHFKLVEVQQTFYKPPQLATALRWREEAPADFEFTIKAWQLITHACSSPTYRKAGLNIPKGKEANCGFFRPTEEVMAAWHTTTEIAEALRARAIVFQCPPSFREEAENIKNMRIFFRALGRKRKFLFVWEPRGEWSDEGVRALCEELDLVHCVDPFRRGPLYGVVNYFRLHGGPGYRHKYSDEELEWLGNRWGEGYFLFNNLSMYDDALRFERMVKGDYLYLGNERSQP